MATVQGTCDPRFSALKDALQKKITSGEEVGAAIVVNIDGQNVVDIYGGYTDESHSAPWTADTIVNVWSSTKTISALAVLMLHDRGLLDVHENVSTYWPEFAANGKQNVKVRHLLSHTSGVSGWDQPFTLEDLLDLKKSTEQLATQAPWFEPGSASGYHALTMGQLLGELVRRTTGKSLKQFVAEEMAGPVGADFQIGAKEEDWARIANVIPPPPLPFDIMSLGKDNLTVKTLTSPPVDASVANTPEWRRAELGAVNGHGTARGLNRILSAVSLGGSVDGHKLLSQKTIDLIFEEQANGADLVLMIPVRFGIGYGLTGGSTSQTMPYMPSDEGRRIAWWPGWGGSWQMMDVDKRVTISYIMNKMGPGVTGSDRSTEYVKAVYSVLDG